MVRHAKRLRRSTVVAVGRISTVLVGAAVAATAVGCASGDKTTAAEGTHAAGAAATPALQGTWAGQRERMRAKEGYATGGVTLKITAQTNRTFRGTLTRTGPDGDVTEPLVGAFTPGAALMSGTDREGTYSFRLVGRRTLDYCYQQTGSDFRITCARLTKQR
jgi:hypothetical protein